MINFLWSTPSHRVLILVLMIFSLSIFVVKFTNKLGKTFDEKYRVISAIGIVLAASAASWKYIEDFHTEAERPFLQKQFEFCLDISNSSALLAASLDPLAKIDEKEKWSSANKFMQMMSGSLYLFSDSHLANAVSEFRKKILSEVLKPPIQSESDQLNYAALAQVMAIDISTSCRSLIGESWNINLPLFDVPLSLKEAPSQS